MSSSMASKMPSWLEFPTFWLSTASQRDPVWHSQRTYRLTCSNFGSAAGHNMFCSPEELADDLSGIKKKTRDEKALKIMQYGTDMEPFARKWYEEKHKANVVEIGLAIPKWNTRIGGSVDGLVTSSDPQGIVEIKCPMSMYKPLKNYTASLASGWKPPQNYHEHIWTSHYDQMMGCMAIVGAPWCDYLVYCEEEDNAFEQRIPFDQEYWEGDLYPKVKSFIENLLDPRLKQRGIEVKEFDPKK